MWIDGEKGLDNLEVEQQVRATANKVCIRKQSYIACMLFFCAGQAMSLSGANTALSGHAS